MPPVPLADPRLLLIAAVGLAYATAFSGTFQFDDWRVIVHDARVQSLSAWWASMPGIRPLLKLSYALNHAGGAGLAGFHAVNVATHAGSALLAYALLLRLGTRTGLDARAARRVALSAALIFAVHPVQTEAVTYLSGRSVSLSGCFALGSLLAWIEGRERGSRWLAAGVSGLLFVAALGVRETVVVLPLAAMLWQATGPRPSSAAAGRQWPVAGFWGIVIAALAAMWAMPTYRHLLETSLSTRGLGENLWLQAQAIVWLAGQMLRPDLLNADPLLQVNPNPAAGVAAATAVTAAISAGFALLRRSPPVAFGILWFFVWLAPTNSLLPRLDAVNDRQLYVPLLGPAWLAALALESLCRRRPRALALAPALVLALGAATASRNLVYADEIRFWEDVERKSPNNARALNNLGYAYAIAGRRAEADSSFARALSISPGDTRAAVNLRLLRQGGLDTGR